MPQPLDIFCKWLVPNDHETILGIQVCNLCNDDLSWNEMIKNLYVHILMDSKISNNVWLDLCYKRLCDKQKLALDLYNITHSKNGLNT